MRKPKMIGFINFWLLIVALARVCNTQGIFEDADTSKDYASSEAYPLFELRHTIPGEPEVDYPILSKVPETSFKCTGRHEGYYADLETRCQAFRICAHTARSVHGFAFLCPNGTLFNQKHFVCDWYRNVNCEESEKYYSKNNANRIGSNFDMMERVRQMMEYPMKTISKALQNKINTQTRSTTPKASHQTLKKQLELGESGFGVSEVDAVQQSSSNQQGYATRQQAATRTQFESDSHNGGYEERKHIDESSSKEHNSVEQHTETLSNNNVAQGTQTNNGEIYVNSLGELSSDPGVDFVHDTAHILAEPPQRTKNGNKNSEILRQTAVELNKDVTVPSKRLVPPEISKIFNHLQSNDEFILASNINNLLNDVSADLQSSAAEPQVFSPEKNASSFRFLSRGFSSQNERAKQSAYDYDKPKQTASTIRFSANELPIDDIYKAGKGHAVQKGGLSLITSTYDSTTESANAVTQRITTPIPIKQDDKTSESSEEILNNIPTEKSEPSRGFSSAQDYNATEVSHITNNYYLNAVSKEPRNLDYNFLSPPKTELTEEVEGTTADAPTLFEFTNFAEDINVVTEASKGLTNNLELLPDMPTVRAEMLTKEDTNDVSLADAVPTPSKIFLPPDTPAPAKDDSDTSTYPTVVDDDKLDADNYATTLLLAGVKLTTHNHNGVKENAQEPSGSVITAEQSGDKIGALLIRVENEIIDELHNSSEIVTTPPTMSTVQSTTPIVTTTTTTPQPEASASVIQSLSEADNFQERIRSYRRFSTHQRSTTNVNNVEKEMFEHELGKTKLTNQKSTSSSTTTTPIPKTRSYLKRVAASRLRLSRPTADNNRNETSSTSDTTAAGDDSSEANKKVAVRNIEKEIGNVDSTGSKTRPDSRSNSFYYSDTTSKRRKAITETTEETDSSSGAVARETSRKRVQARRRTTTVASNQRKLTKAARNAAVRRRNRFMNIKTSTDGTTAVTTTTSATTTSTEATTMMITTTTPPPHSMPIDPESNLENSQTQNFDHLLNSTTSTPTSQSFVSSSNLQTTNISEARANTRAVATNVEKPLNDSINPEHSSTDDIATTTTLDLSGSTSSFSEASSSHSSTSSSHISSQSSGSSLASSDDPTTFIDFTKLAHAIADDSVLQSFRAPQSAVYQPAVSTAESRSQEYNKLPAQAPSQLIPPPRPQYLPQVLTPKPHTPTSPSPRVVIAPAVGQRISPTSFSSVISALVTQPPPKPTTSTLYVPLDDFLTKKFGHTAATKSNSIYNNKKQATDIYSTTSSQPTQFYQGLKTNGVFEQPQLQTRYDAQHQQQQNQYIQYKQQQLEQLHQYQQQQQQYQQQQQQYQQQQQQYQQQNAKQQSFNTHFSNIAGKLSQPPQQYSPNDIYNAPQQSTFAQPSSYQQKLNQQYAQHSQQKHAYLPPTQQKYQPQQTSPTHLYFPQQQQSTQITSHAFSPNRQQQRSFSTAPQSNIFQPQLTQFPPLGSSASLSTQHLPFNDVSNNIVLPQVRDVHLNIKLPALTAGLIPAPTAQRRADILEDTESEISDDQLDTSKGSYSGASSYDVPLSSIGRLPNDITHLLRRLRRVK